MDELSLHGYVQGAAKVDEDEADGTFTQFHSNDGYLTEAWLGVMGTWLTQKNLEISANVICRPSTTIGTVVVTAGTV